MTNDEWIALAKPLLEALARGHKTEDGYQGFIHAREMREGCDAYLAALDKDAEARCEHKFVVGFAHCCKCERMVKFGTAEEERVPSGESGKCPDCGADMGAPSPKRDAVDPLAEMVVRLRRFAGPVSRYDTGVIAGAMKFAAECADDLERAIRSERAAVAKREKGVARVAQQMHDWPVARTAISEQIRVWAALLCRPVERSEGEQT